MFKNKYLILVFFVLLACKAGQDGSDVLPEPEEAASTAFETGVIVGTITSDELEEASGLAFSQSNPNVIWSHNDSGGRPAIYLVGDQGEDLGYWLIEDAVVNRDWEDMSCSTGPKPNTSYIYVAEIGDNVAIYEYKYIYRFEEPNVSGVKTFTKDTIKTPVDIIKFQFPDGKRDAEALFVDPLSNDIYIISKRETNVNLYRAAYPQPLDQSFELEFVLELPYSGITAADMSLDGKELLVKNYGEIFYYERALTESIISMLQRQPVSVDYIQEPQGEAICWSFDGESFFTLSETTPLSSTADLYRYMKK